MQEVMLSSNNYLLYGDKPLPWQIFANFLSLVDVRFKCPQKYVRQVHSSTAKTYAESKPYKTLPPNLQWQMGSHLTYDFGRQWDVEEHNLFRILNMFGDRDCSDALDHVYALLSLTSEGRRLSVRYGIKPIQLFMTVIHFCGGMAKTNAPDVQIEGIFWPASQRAFFRNARYLAEIIGLAIGHTRTQPYFPGTGTSLGYRGPNPRPDPCFPCENQVLALRCSVVEVGNEPPALRSNSLQRNLARFSYDILLHVDESNSWLLCTNDRSEEPTLVALVTIKDSAQGRGFKILECGPLSMCGIAAGSASVESILYVPPAAHLHLLKALILQEQPT